MARLPPLNALRAFEAAARHGGFVGASAELHVTRGAISRHVKLLEEHLGVPLFVRHAQGVRLTADGQRLLPVATEAFGLIAREADRIASTRPRCVSSARPARRSGGFCQGSTTSGRRIPACACT